MNMALIRVERYRLQHLEDQAKLLALQKKEKRLVQPSQGERKSARRQEPPVPALEKKPVKDKKVVQGTIRNKRSTNVL